MGTVIMPPCPALYLQAVAECGQLQHAQLVLSPHLQHLNRGMLPYLASLQLEITDLSDLQVRSPQPEKQG